MQMNVNHVEGTSCQCKCLPLNFSKVYLDFQKEKGIQKWVGIVVKSVKRSGAVQKYYHWIKGRAAKFHKSSITFWDKAVLQPKNEQKSTAVTQSVGVSKNVREVRAF